MKVLERRSTDGTDVTEQLLAQTDDALRRFEADPDRRTLADRESALRRDLTELETALTTLRPPAAEDHAVALAEGRTPASDARAPWRSQRGPLEERRRLLGEALEVLARRRAETDVRVARAVLGPLVAPYRRVVAEQARRVRAVAEANDGLARVSGELERAGCLGASAILFPMIFHAAGAWADPSSPARYFWREAIEHGFVREAE